MMKMPQKVKGIGYEIEKFGKAVYHAERAMFLKYHEGLCKKCPHNPDKIVKKTVNPK